MTRATYRTNITIIVLLVAALLLSGCFPKKIMADEVQAPAPKEITGRLYESTIGQIIDQPASVGDVWLLPTPTPVPEDLFDRAFGKAREMLPTPIPAVVHRTERWGTVTVPTLNVRSGPGTDSPVISGLTLDQRVKILEETGGWLRVTLPDGQEGWSSADFFVIEEVEVEVAAAAADAKTFSLAALIPAKTEAEQKGVVLADWLNVRSQPDLNGSVVTSLTRTECVDVIGEENGWYQVSTSSAQTGWSSAEYIETADTCPSPQEIVAATGGGVETAQRTGAVAPAQPASQPASSPEPAATVDYAQKPMSANAFVIQETKMHECFGGGWDEIRFVSSNTPVEVIGTGPWTPPPGQEGEVGPGPYLKIRIWDGQYGWIAAGAVDVNLEEMAKISGQCEEGDRIDWSVVAKPTPRPTPQPRPTPRPVPTRLTSTTVSRPSVTGTSGTNTAVTHDHKYRDE